MWLVRKRKHRSRVASHQPTPRSTGIQSITYELHWMKKGQPFICWLPSLICTDSLAPAETGVAHPVPTAIVVVSAGHLPIALDVAVSFTHFLALTLCCTMVAFAFKLAKLPTIMFQFALVTTDVTVDAATITTATIFIVANVITAPPIPVTVMASIIGASPAARAMRSPVMVLRHHRTGTGQC